MDRQELKVRVDRIDFFSSHDPAKILKELKTLLKEAKKLKDVYYVGKINLYLAICYFELGNRDEFLPYAIKAVDIFQKLNDRIMLARSYNLLGLAYRAQGNYLRAIESYNRALEMIHGLKKTGIRKDVMQNNIAECYYLLGEYQTSTKLLEQCLRTVQKKSREDHRNIVTYGINLSDSYECLEEYERSKEILESIKPNVLQLDRDALVWSYYGRKCCALYMVGDLKEAERYADLTIEAIHNGYDSYEFHRDFEKIACKEVELGDYERAQCFADILTKYAESNGNTIDLIIAKRTQACICDSRGERDRTLALYRDINTLFEKRTKEQNAMQYESQKNAEAASREIAKLMKKMRSSEEKAERDPLSGLMNRAALVSVSDEFIKKAVEGGKTLGGIFIDIDYFKGFNDTYGHAAGDDAIRFVARACLEQESANVKFFRYGGDEFFGIVLGRSEEELDKLAAQISRTIRSSGIEHIKNPNGQHLTVTIGVVNVDMTQSDDTILDIIKCADKALYFAKDQGRDVVYGYRATSEEDHDYRRISV